ncbi:MAG: translation initiation factor IF-3 [Firmicutes bacterium]|nr:translation initiation factor IF-3 [Bacillota bacterium]
MATPVFYFIRRCKTISKDLLVNEQIRAREVRLVDESGKQLGIVPLSEALKLAKEKNLDLVNVAPQAKPPVCRIMDFGKYKYEQRKKDKEAKKKQKTITVKEIKMRPNIEEHDFKVKVKNCMRFLDNGDKVKVTIIFRGREITHPELGEQLGLKLAEELSSVGVVEKPAKIEGRNMVMVLSPKNPSGSK